MRWVLWLLLLPWVVMAIAALFPAGRASIREAWRKSGEGGGGT